MRKTTAPTHTHTHSPGGEQEMPTDVIWGIMGLMEDAVAVSEAVLRAAEK